MPGDYSRRLFLRKKHYSGVLMQQGRVQLDADWNEQLDIQLYRTETEAIDVIGRCGVPRKNGGFVIGAGPGNQDLTISAGRIYVDGLLCELEEASTYITQPHLPNPENTSAVTSPPSSPPGPTRRLSLPDGNYVVYLDTWQQERTFLDDALIREVALGGPDHTARLQNIWQVKLLPVKELSPPGSPPTGPFTCKTPFPEFQQLTASSTGKLNAQTAPPKPEEDPCLLPPTSGYSLLENQLYRIEIHNGGELTAAGGAVTFKWSRENASVQTSVVSIADDVATVTDPGKDKPLSFANNQWIELVDEESTLKASKLTTNLRPLMQIDSVNPGTREITFKSSLASFSNLVPGLKLRRWDQSEDADQNGVQAVADVWIDVEAGVQVRFSPGTYRTGDYWLIPARTATREIEWPPFKIPNTTPEAQPPRGIRHHFCRLALLTVTNGALQLQDCRPTFPPLTELMDFFHVGGTGQEAGPGGRLPCALEVGVTNGHLPVSGARVRFSAAAGTLHSGANSGPSLIVETDAQGVARCEWELPTGASNLRCLQVEAVLFDDEGNPFAPALHFNANIRAGGEQERGIRITQITTTADNQPLRNDTLVPVSRLQKGLTITCDQNLAPHAGGGPPPPPSSFEDSRTAAKPTCFVTIDLPYPLGADANFWDFTQVVGFQPLILGGNVLIQEQRISWFPSSDANAWLQNILFTRLQRSETTDRVLAHLTVKGNFIFAANDPVVNVDGNAFGRPRNPDRIDLQLPSGDGRRGGDLEMWFWLIRPEATPPTGLNLTATVAPGAAGVSSIRGSLLDNTGASVPGATINLDGPGGARTATTDAQGAFTFPNLRRGTYRVSVTVGQLSAEQTLIVA